METRHIIAAIIVLICSVGMAIALAFGIMRFYPQLLGMDGDGHFLKRGEMPEMVVDSTNNEIIIEDELPTVSTVSVTLDKIKRYEFEIQNKEALQNENDSLIKVSQSLMDSIDVIIASSKSSLDSIDIIHDAYRKAKAENQKLKDSLKSISNIYLEKDDKIEKLSKELEEKDNLLTAKMDTLEAEHYRNLAKIYNYSNPIETARALEQLDEKDAAIILRMMRKKISGQVLDAMNPATSAAIIQLGVTALPPEEEKEEF
jgi:flagellar motility protein MotE (MotC chaperone)